MYLTDMDTTHINTGLTTDITIPLDVNFHIKLRIYAGIHLPCQR